MILMLRFASFLYISAQCSTHVLLQSLHWSVWRLRWSYREPGQNQGVDLQVLTFKHTGWRKQDVSSSCSRPSVSTLHSLSHSAAAHWRAFWQTSQPNSQSMQWRTYCTVSQRRNKQERKIHFRSHVQQKLFLYLFHQTCMRQTAETGGDRVFVWATHNGPHLRLQQQNKF